jgi:hypothetical protein
MEFKEEYEIDTVLYSSAGPENVSLNLISTGGNGYFILIGDERKNIKLNASEAEWLYFNLFNQGANTWFVTLSKTLELSTIPEINFGVNTVCDNGLGYVPEKRILTEIKGLNKTYIILHMHNSVFNPNLRTLISIVKQFNKLKI